MGQDLFWWLQYGAPKKSRGSWVLSDWKNIRNWNFAGSFLDSIQDLGILFSSIGRSVELKFKFFQEKSGFTNFLDSPTNYISYLSSENFKQKLKWSNWVFIEFNRFFIKLASEVTRFGHPWLIVTNITYRTCMFSWRNKVIRIDCFTINCHDKWVYNHYF